MKCISKSSLSMPENIFLFVYIVVQENKPEVNVERVGFDLGENGFRSGNGH